MPVAAPLKLIGGRVPALPPHRHLERETSTTFKTRVAKANIAMAMRSALFKSMSITTFLAAKLQSEDYAALRR